MKKTFTIDVTQEDIGDGKALHCRLCPIALSANRATGLPVEVNNCYINFYKKSGDGFPIERAELPDGAKRFIYNFDRGASVSPFSFPLTIDLPEGAVA